MEEHSGLLSKLLSWFAVSPSESPDPDTEG
jgi:hypothetical protein